MTRAWTIPDSSTLELPGFELPWLPNHAYRYVTPRLLKRGTTIAVALTAGAYVGALPLDNGDTLYIVPRAGQRSLSHMLMVTERLESSVRREFDELARLGTADGDAVSWLALLARSFGRQLRLIEKSSLRFDRVWESARRQSVRGHIDLVPTLTSLARRETQPIHATYRSHTYESPEHYVLGAAAALLLDRGVAVDEEREVLRRWVSRFGDQRRLQDHLAATIRRLNAGHFTGPRAYYIRALVMAQLILAQGGITLALQDWVEGEAFLTNVYTLFESYVRITLRNYLSERGYIVEKRESSVPALFADGTAMMIPDVIISDRSGVCLIVDAKYKLGSGIESGDYYQMATYLQGFRTQRGMIVRPSDAPESGSLVQRRMSHGGLIYEVTLGLADVLEAEAALQDAVSTAVAPAGS